MIEGRLGYNSYNDRYGLLVSDLWEMMGFIAENVWKLLWMKNGFQHEWRWHGMPMEVAGI